MFILFFIVHLFFAYLLYLLDAYFEAGAFVLLGVGSIVLFSPYRFFAKKEKSEHASMSETVGGMRSQLTQSIISFFSQQALFLSIVTTDIALMGIIYGGQNIFGISLEAFVSGFVLFLTLGGIAAVFLEYFQSNTVRQVVEIHVPIVGLFLLIGYFLQGQSPDLFYNFAFLGATGFVGTLIFYGGLPQIKRQIYALVFWILCFMTVIVWAMYFDASISWETMTTFLFLYSVGFFEGVSLPRFKAFREPIRAISLLGLYLSTISYSVLLFTGESYWTVLFLLLSLAFNVYVHARFENYPSLVFSTVIPVPIYYFFFGISDNFWGFLISSLLVTLGLTFF